MADLHHSKIYRGGATATYLSLETRKCNVRANKKDRCLDIKFELASKGGGTTQVLVQLGDGDFETIIGDLAETLPHHATTLATGAAKANAKNLTMLRESLRANSDTKELKKTILDQLEPVEEYISEKYFEAESGSDEREAELRDKLERLVIMLRG